MAAFLDQMVKRMVVIDSSKSARKHQLVECQYENTVLKKERGACYL
ncbi:hypothetical protein RU98_GL002406 [Enterococcus caccae]|nr:hypothetical protein RU98_GL002406 [Enterococcus caccae]